MWGLDTVESLSAKARGSKVAQSLPLLSILLSTLYVMGWEHIGKIFLVSTVAGTKTRAFV